MSIIGIDVGSTTTKIIEYNDKKIIKSKISLNINAEEVLEEFIKYNSIDINNIEIPKEYDGRSILRKNL